MHFKEMSQQDEENSQWLTLQTDQHNKDIASLQVNFKMSRKYT